MKNTIKNTQNRIKKIINLHTKKAIRPELDENFDDIISIINNGNKFRALMMFFVTKSLNSSLDTKKILDIASGVEILHRSTLIHDDIVDGDNERNGKPCNHISQGLHEGIYIPLILKEYVLNNCITDLTLQSKINRVWSDVAKGQILEKILANKKILHSKNTKKL